MRISVVVLALSIPMLATGCQSPMLRDSFTWKRDAASSNPVADNKPAPTAPATGPTNPWPANSPAVAQQQRPASNPTLDSELAKGTAAVAAGRPTQAAIHFESVLKLDGQNAVAHHMLAQINDQQKEYDKAERHYLAALSAQPTNVAVLCNLGWSYAQQDRPQEAREYLIRALTIEPSHKMSLVNLGSVAVDLGESGQAMSYFRQVTNNEEEAGRMFAQQLSRKHDKLKNLAKKPGTSTPQMAGKSYAEMQQLMQLEKERQQSLQAAADRSGRELEQFERYRREQILASGGQPQQRGNAFPVIAEQDMNGEFSRLDQESADQYRDQRRSSAQRSNAPMIVDPEIARNYGSGQQLPPNGGPSGYQAQSQPAFGGGPDAWKLSPNQGLPPIPGLAIPNTVAGQYGSNQFGSNQYAAPGFDPNGSANGSNGNPNMLAQGGYPAPAPNLPLTYGQGQVAQGQYGQGQFGPSNNLGTDFGSNPNLGQPQPSGSQYYGAMPSNPATNQPMNQAGGNYAAAAVPNQPGVFGTWVPGQQNFGNAMQPSNQQAGFQQAPNQSSVGPARQAIELGMSAGPGAIFQFPSGTGYEAQRPAYQGTGAPAPQGQQYPPNGPTNMPPQGFGQQPQFGPPATAAGPAMQLDANGYRSMPGWQNQATGPSQRMQ